MPWQIYSVSMASRKEILKQIADPLTALYGEREAHSIALIAATELSGVRRSAFLVDPDAPLEIEGLDEVVERLKNGEPVQYVTGRTEFYGREFGVGQGVLIPRPETEELVDWIVHREGGKACVLLDVGTGSGCIAASLKLEMPPVKVFAVDLSEDALRIAQQNFERLGAEVELRRGDALGDLWEVIREPLDVIVSNPPYVPAADLEGMDRNVRDFEPHMALFVPDNDPLLFYRAIARAGQRMLREGGRLYFEIYHAFAGQMRQMLLREGYCEVEVREDLFGKPRMICCRKK